MRSPQVLRVEAGQSIQAAVDQAIPGDTIEVMPGLYHEQIVVDVADLTLRAVGAANRNDNANSDGLPADGSRRPLLDGQRRLSDGIIISGKNFRLEGFDIKDYTANAVFGQYARDLALADLRLEKSGRFGIHTINSSNVTIEHIRASRMAEAGFYFNSSSDIKLSACETYGNVVGVNVENCLRTTVETNFIHDNACGILISALPADLSTIARYCRISGNHLLNNNAKNTSELGTLVAEVPSGIGILVLGADNTEIFANELRGNMSYAVGILGYHSFSGSGIKIGIESVPENNYIHDNTYSDNGRSPDTLVMKAGFKGGDLVWDLSGWSNKWHEEGASRATPVLDAKWPAFIRRIRWRMLNLLK
jgi:parallel beta-helix repeat protein